MHAAKGLKLRFPPGKRIEAIQRVCYQKVWAVTRRKRTMWRKQVPFACKEKTVSGLSASASLLIRDVHPSEQWVVQSEYYWLKMILATLS